jgi:hypothetical protein
LDVSIIVLHLSQNLGSMKKTKQITYVALAGAAALSVGSCGKYEDGPGFALSSKKSRVVGEWEVATIAGVPMDPGYSLNFIFEKDGSFEYKYSYASYSYSYLGTWDFASDKEELAVTVDGYTSNFDIKRLASKELWLDDDATDVDGDIWKLDAL